MTHHIIITHGEDEEYGIEGLYACDHAVDPKEWSDLLQQFYRDWEEFSKNAWARHGGRYGWGHIPAAHEERCKWRNDNFPWPAFAAKHGLKKVEYVEIWK